MACVVFDSPQLGSCRVFDAPTEIELPTETTRGGAGGGATRRRYVPQPAPPVAPDLEELEDELVLQAAAILIMEMM